MNRPSVEDKAKQLEGFEKGYWKADFDGTDNCVVIEIWSPQLQSIAIFLLHYDPERGGMIHIDQREGGDTERYNSHLKAMMDRFHKEIKYLNGD